jgi:hypothetical protein
LKLEAEPLEKPYLLGALLIGVCSGFIVLRTRIGLFVLFLGLKLESELGIYLFIYF